MYPGHSSICTVTARPCLNSGLSAASREMIARIPPVPVDPAVGAARANTRGFERAKALVLEAGSGSWRTLTRQRLASRLVLA